MVKSHNEKLATEDFSWLSTEIIESAFGAYKQFEGLQSWGSFAFLLPTFANIFKPTTIQEVSQAVDAVKMNASKVWLKENLPNTSQYTGGAYEQTLKTGHQTNGPVTSRNSDTCDKLNRFSGQPETIISSNP